MKKYSIPLAVLTLALIISIALYTFKRYDCVALHSGHVVVEMRYPKNSDSVVPYWDDSRIGINILVQTSRDPSPDLSQNALMISILDYADPNLELLILTSQEDLGDPATISTLNGHAAALTVKQYGDSKTEIFRVPISDRVVRIDYDTTVAQQHFKSTLEEVLHDIKFTNVDEETEKTLTGKCRVE